MTVVDRLVGLITGVAIKAPCRAATTGNTSLSGLQTIDGVSLVDGDRVLVRSQSDPTLNGIYTADGGTWSRPPDFDGSNDFVQGTIVAVVSGTVYNGTVWQLTTANPAIGSSLAFTIMGTGALSGVSTFMQTVLPALTAAIARTTLGAVGLTGNETVAGDKTFTGASTFSDVLTMSGAPINEDRGSNVVSASTIDLDAVTGNLIDVTGTVTVTAITLADGAERTVRTTNALVWTNGANLVLPTGANITTAPGDYWTFRGHGAGVVRMAGYQLASGRPLVQGVFTIDPFISSDTAYTNGSLTTLAHGLGTSRLVVQLMFICQSNDQGYTTGQTIVQGPAGSASNIGSSVVIDATNVGVLVGSGGVFVINNGAYTGAALDPTKWKIRVIAFAY